MSLETEPLSRLAFGNKQFVIGRVGAAAFRGENADYEATTLESRQSGRLDMPQNPNPYEQLGIDLYGVFASAACRANLDSAHNISIEDGRERQKATDLIPTSPAILSGFLVTGRLMSLVPRAYQQFCDVTDRTPNMADVRTILKNDRSFEDTAKFLAKMPNDLNRIWEGHMLLRGSLYLYARKDITESVLAITDEAGLPHLTISRSIKYQAAVEAHRSEIYPSDEKVCSATHVFLPKLWSMMADECCQNPALFAADLDIEPLPIKQVE